MSDINCWICDAACAGSFFEAPRLPVHCNVLWPDAAAARAAPRGNVRLVACENCGHVFNADFQPETVGYGQQYENSLHFSPRFQQYAQELAGDLVSRYDLVDSTILEIGSGKGEFLAMLCAGGANRGLGFDSSYEPDLHGATGGTMTISREMFSSDTLTPPADLICCRHVLEHIPAPREFVRDIHKAAERHPSCGVFFEVPNVFYTLRDLGIWDIIYEHCSYFSAASLARLFATSGFSIDEVRPAFGEQYLCLHASVEGNPAPDAPDWWETEAREVAALAREFGAHYRRKLDGWQERLNELSREGRRVVIWGAGSKGVTFLNCVAGADVVREVVDVNPRKQGRFVAGTGQMVSSPDVLRGGKGITILVMNPLYSDEIAGMTRGLGLQAELETV